MSEVSLVKCNSYDEIKLAIQKSINLLGGIDKFIQPQEKILLKPNLCDPIVPEKAATTHPYFIKAVIEIVKDAKAIPIIGELAAGNSKDRTRETFRVTGIEKIANETNTEIRNFQEENFVPREIQGYKVLEKTDFAEYLDEVDKIINLPKLKGHGVTYLTCAIKNFFGCVHPQEREYLHKNFSEVEKFSQGIVDIFSVIKPKINLNIVNAVVGMQGDESPSYGNPIKIGYVITGSDAVSVDAISSKLTGHRPLAIPLIYDAFKRKFGEADIRKIKVLGEELTSIKKFDKHSNYENRNKDRKSKEFVLQPKISKKCVKCGICFENCPVDAISGNKKSGFKINEEKCIQCYCCQEMCVHEAISLQKKWLVNKLAPYFDGKNLVQRDKKIPAKLTRLNPQSLDEFDPVDKLNLISFQIEESDLNQRTGEIIIDFLETLIKNNIDFKISRPLPKCLFKHKYKEIMDMYGLPENCFECFELFTFNEKNMAVSCNILNNRLGPRKDYFSKREDLSDYFNTFYKEMQIFEKCNNCIYKIRGQCDGLCFRR